MTDITNEADAMHAYLLKRIEALMGCTENSPEEAELKALVDVVEPYEKKRWPMGRPEDA